MFMKKVFLGIASVLFFSAGAVSAQECMALFPNTKGAQMVNKCYDAQNNLISTSTYTVQESYENLNGGDANIGFALTDGDGQLLDQGILNVNCNGENFFMKLVSKSDSPTAAMSLLAGNTELVGNYLDYPNTFVDEYPFDNTFAMEPAEFMVYDKVDKKHFVKVNVRNRKFEKNEKVTTPAGTFNASKISFDYDVYDSQEKKLTTYKGMEWYSLENGIVRSETYNKSNQLVNYSVLDSTK